MRGGLGAIALLVGSVVVSMGGSALAQVEPGVGTLFHLPAPAGTPLLVTQGNDTGSLGGDHIGVSRYAYDFAIVSGTPFPVVAARAGTVLSVSSDVPEGNCPHAGEAVPPPCWIEANHVVLDHGDGTAALYLHLAADSLTELHPGQKLERGQLLGTAGTSGWTSGTKLHFMVMNTEQVAGAPSWWRQSVGPVAFADPSVVAAHPDGVPGSGLLVDGPFTSANPGPDEPLTPLPPDARRPLEMPGDLPGRLPWAAGTAHSVRETKASSADGFGFVVVSGGRDSAISEATEVYPLFGGVLRYVGCATGTSAGLGRIVVVERLVAGRSYLAAYSHLSSIDPALGALLTEVDPNQPLGTFGSSRTASDGSCDGQDGKGARLHVGLFRDATVTPAGELRGGRVVRPWPLLGEGSYAPMRWWAGPMRAIDLQPALRGPRGRWSGTTTRDAAHLAYGQPVELVLRAQGEAELREVRILAQHADWAQPRKGRFRGLDPKRIWRLLAVCRPEGLGGVPGTTRDCRWNGDARSATITYRWDPTVAEPRGRAPWLPPAVSAIGTDDRDCVPVTLAFEVSDASGRRFTPSRGKVARRCDAKANGLGRTVYLDPLQPPSPPTAVTLRCLEPFELGCGRWSLSWKHPDTGTARFRVYAERPLATTYVNGKCKVVKHAGRWPIAGTVAGARKWPVDVLAVYRPPEKALGKDWRLVEVSLSVSAYNAAGESVPVAAARPVDIGDDVIC